MYRVIYSSSSQPSVNLVSKGLKSIQMYWICLQSCLQNHFGFKGSTKSPTSCSTIMEWHWTNRLNWWYIPSLEICSKQMFIHLWMVNGLCYLINHLSTIRNIWKVFVEHVRVLPIQLGDSCKNWQWRYSAATTQGSSSTLILRLVAIRTSIMCY